MGRGIKNEGGGDRHPGPVTNGGAVRARQSSGSVADSRPVGVDTQTHHFLIPQVPDRSTSRAPRPPAQDAGRPVLPACFHGNKIKLRDERSVWWWCTGGQGAEESSSSGVGASPRYYTRLRLCPELSRLRLPSPSLNRKYVITHLK